MRKFITSFVALGLMVSTVIPLGAHAQTSVQDALTKIQELTKQIKALQEQMLGLKKQQTELQATATQATAELVQSLRQGSEGDQVTLLQTLLALDASIYPEGRVTGFFGPATRRAIERFQKKNGLESVGFVGPRTRSELNKLIRQEFKEIRDLEDDLDDDIAEDIERSLASITLPSLPTDPCGIPGIPIGPSSLPFMQKDGKLKIIQTGNVFIYKNGKHKIIITPNTYHEKNGKKQLVITPGMRFEKDGKSKIVVPCHGTTTPPATGSDTTAPVISQIVSSPAQTSAGITWKTDEPATGKVFFGTTSPLNVSAALSVTESNWFFNNLNTNHAVNLAGLSASTTYHFVIESKDKKGNTATSSQQSFTTGVPADSQAPTITAISSSNVSTSTARIQWNTNEVAKSKVYYGTTTPLNTASAANVVDLSLVTAHTMNLTGLTPNTTYYFRVESADAAGNTTTGSETSFITNALPPVDAVAPVISAIVTTPASTTAQVSWATNESATSKVYFGTTTPLVLGSAQTVSSASLVTSHSQGLTGLSASTTYYIVIESKDSANNTATSSEVSFLTL